MSNTTDIGQERVPDPTAQSPSPSALPAGVYMIRRGKDQKPHSISVPVTAEDVEEHKKKTGDKLGRFPLTLNESGQERPFHEFKNTHEFVSGMYDSVLAHKHLWSDARKLHGNISPNVMFFNEHGKGVLVDWDHSPNVAHLARRIMRELNYDDVDDDSNNRSR